MHATTVSKEHRMNNPWIYAEFAWVLLIGGGKFIFQNWLQFDMVFVCSSCLLLVLYIAIRCSRNPLQSKRWGVAKSCFRNGALQIGSITLISVLVFLMYGILTGRALFHWHILPVLLLYPVWGFIQQFLVIDLLAFNLNRLTRYRLPRLLIILSTAFLFALVHIPSLTLICATFVLGCTTLYLFLRFRNLWLIGIFHGWFATSIYFFVMGTDPFIELLTRM
jgi:uncharacterized protein